MAFATGTAIGAQALLLDLSTFLQANGWTLHDTVATNDLVFKSTGTDGKQLHFVRVTNVEKFLDYKSQSANFTVGQLVTGGTSGATGIIIADTDNGTSGTLALIEVNPGLGGPFQDGEALTDALTGSATVDGHLHYKLWKDPTHIDNCFDFLHVRAYLFWDNVGHTGSFPQGQWGPMNLYYPHNQSAAWQVMRTENPALFGPYIYDPGLNSNSPFGGAGGINNGAGGLFGNFDGVRRLHGFPQGGNYGPYNDGNHHWIMDLPSIPNPVTANNSPTVNSTSSQGMIVYDKANDRYYVYAFQNTSNPNNMFVRWNFDTDAWETLGATPFNDQNYPRFAWDGNDTIFCAKYNQTVFGRYKISTNTWDTLTALPEVASLQPGGGFCKALYIPKGIIPGVTEDVIYWILNTQNKLWRYNVTSNTWEAGGNNITIPENIESDGGGVWWDHNRYVYASKGDSNESYVMRLDLTNIGGGWLTQPAVVQTGNAYQHGKYIAPYTCRIKTKNGVPITYFFVGDGDSVKVITKLTQNGQDNYYWSYFGKINSAYKLNIATTIGTTAPGSPANAHVDDSTGFAAGDNVLVLDPTTGAVVAATVNAVPDGSHLQLLLKNSLAAGSKVFIDAVNCCLTGDSWLATMGHDALGYHTQGMEHAMVLTPLVNSGFTDRGGPSIRSKYQFFDMVVAGHAPGLGTFENRGKLLGVYVLKNAATLNSEDVIQNPVDGKQYMIVNARNSQHTNDPRFVAIGPLN